VTDLSLTVAPKSDQLNADDLIAGPRVITITKVNANQSSAEQPIAIYFEGDNGKPYLPCKSMRRVLIHVWGKDGNKFAGRSMTLYRDAKVVFGGLAVGGIRISHMSHMTEDMTMALTATRASRKPYTVKPLQVEHSAPSIADYESCATVAELTELETRRAAMWKSVPSDAKIQLKAASDAAKARLNAPMGGIAESVI